MKTNATTLFLSCLVLFLVLATAAAYAQEIDSLRNEIKQFRQKVSKIDELELRLADLEKDSARVQQLLAPQERPASLAKPIPAIPSRDLRETEKPLTGNDLVEAEFLGSWPMFGTDYRLKVGGYVKTDMLYDVDGTTDRTQFLMSTIPVEGTPEHANKGYFSAFSRETRFNIDVRRVTPGAVPLRLFVEGDFWSSGNQFRLRHAYVTVNKFIVGQTWTTLSFLEALPFLIDFAAGDALFGGRASQIRYQRRVGENWKMAVALEMLDYMGIENPNNLAGQPSLGLPLLAVRVDYHRKSTLLLFGSSVAQLRWDGGAAGPDAKGLQFDVVFAGRQYLGESNYLTWNVAYGKGSGENIMAFTGSHANAVLTPDGMLETMPAFSAVAGFMHRWNEEFSSNFSYAYGWLDTPESRAPLALRRGGVGHVNVIWSPPSAKKFSSGIGYMWGAERTTNLAVGSASRIQGMVKLEF